MHKFKLSHAKTIVQNLSKQSQTFQNLSKQSQTFPKRFQTNSSNSENLWRWYVQRLALFQNAQNNMQYLMSVTSQLRNPLAKTATSSDTTNYWGGPFLRACFFLRFEDQKRVPSLSYCFASISIGLRPSRPERLGRKTYWHKDKARLTVARGCILLKSQQGWSSWHLERDGLKQVSRLQVNGNCRNKSL